MSAEKVAEEPQPTGKRRRSVLRLVREVGYGGLTWKSLAELEGLHHGQASGALSALHREGWVERLAEKRDKCSVYVAPEWVHGRDTVPYPLARQLARNGSPMLELELAQAREEIATWKRKATDIERRLTRADVTLEYHRRQVHRYLTLARKVVLTARQAHHPLGAHTTDACVMCLAHSLLVTHEANRYAEESR